MRKIMSKILIILTIIVVLFEFPFSSISFAAEEGIDEDTINLISNLIGGIVSILVWIPKLITTAILWAFSFAMTNLLEIQNGGSAGLPTIMTPFAIFFNKYDLLNINFFDTSVGGTGNDKIIPKIRANVAQWFYAARNFSAIILLLILIYVGIRMALSTVASDRAKYKKMLFDWGISLVLVFTIQYLAIFLINLNNAIVGLIAGAIEGEDALPDAITRILTESLVGLGTSGMMAFLVYSMIAIQSLFFLIGYLNRVLKVAFLLIISPLISITYSIDKMGDGKAQALEAWLKEFIFTILIQPFDCIMYFAFVNTSIALLAPNQSEIDFLATLGLSPEVNEIANGVLAVLCLKFIHDGEKIIRKVFNFSDDNSSTGMGAGAAVAVMALQKTTQAAKKGANIANKGKTTFANSKLANSKFVNNATQKLGDISNKVSTAINNTGIGQALNKVKKTISGVNQKKNQFFTTKNGQRLSKYGRKASSLALGSMAAAMIYASGDTGGMEAFAAGKRVYNMTDEKFSGSLNTAVANVAESNNALEEAAEQENNEKYDEQIDEATRDLEENGVSEEDMDDVEGLEEKANEAEDELDATREQVARERREARIAEIDEATANLEALIAARPDKVNPKRLEELDALRKEKEELENSEITEDELDATNDDERVVEAYKKASKAHAISQKAAERRDLMAQKEAFYTEDALKQRCADRAVPVDESEIQAQVDRILRLILEVKMQKEKDKADETDTNTTNVLSPKEYDSAARTTQKLVDTIKHGVLAGSNFDVRDYITKHMGVSSFDDPNTLGYHLAKEVDKYKQLEDRKNVANNGYQVAQSLGIDRNSYTARLASTSKTQQKLSKRKQKSDSDN